MYKLQIQNYFFAFRYILYFNQPPIRHSPSPTIAITQHSGSFRLIRIVRAERQGDKFLGLYHQVDSILTHSEAPPTNLLSSTHLLAIFRQRSLLKVRCLTFYTAIPPIECDLRCALHFLSHFVACF